MRFVNFKLKLEHLFKQEKIGIAQWIDSVLNLDTLISASRALFRNLFITENKDHCVTWENENCRPMFNSKYLEFGYLGQATKICDEKTGNRSVADENMQMNTFEPFF